MEKNKSCIILGAGPSIGLAAAKKFASHGYNIALASRDKNKLDILAKNEGLKSINVETFSVDASNESQILDLVQAAEKKLGPVEVAIYNPSKFVKKSFLDLTSKEVEDAWRVTCLGGFIFAREVSKLMINRKRGSIIFTGATAGMRGGNGFAAFAIGKFGLRALAESLAREMHPKGIHVLWVNIDGVIRNKKTDSLNENAEENFMNPDDIANNYFHLHQQPKSTWSHSVELRPWKETF